MRTNQPTFRPIAYQLADLRVLCTPGCLSDSEAQRIVDGGGRADDVHPWTVDRTDSDPDLCCDGCGRVLVFASATADEH